MDESSLNLTVQILVIATKLEKVNSALLIYNLNQYKRESASCLAYKSFLIMLRMAKTMHNFNFLYLVLYFWVKFTSPILQFFHKTIQELLDSEQP